MPRPHPLTRKGLVTIERLLGCAESAVLILNNPMKKCYVMQPCARTTDRPVCQSGEQCIKTIPATPDQSRRECGGDHDKRARRYWRVRTGWDCPVDVAGWCFANAYGASIGKWRGWVYGQLWGWIGEMAVIRQFDRANQSYEPLGDGYGAFGEPIHGSI